MSRRSKLANPGATVGVWLAAGGLLLAACERSGGRSGEAPLATDPRTESDRGSEVVLRIGTEALSRAELESLETYLQRVQPSLGRKHTRRELLDQHFLPRMLSRRDHPKLRAEQLEQASGLVSGIATAEELRRRTQLMDLTPQWITWGDIPLPVREWVFDPDNLGGLAPIADVLYGPVALGVLDLDEGPTPQYSRAEVLMVPFPILPQEDYRAWLETARSSLQVEATWVHPDLRPALPDWFPR